MITIENQMPLPAARTILRAEERRKLFSPNFQALVEREKSLKSIYESCSEICLSCDAYPSCPLSYSNL